jgi:hypothetical protein
MAHVRCHPERSRFSGAVKDLTRIRMRGRSLTQLKCAAFRDDDRHEGNKFEVAHYQRVRVLDFASISAG